MNAADAGKKALEAKNYEEAILKYTAALKESPTSPQYLIQRSTAFQRNQDYPSALADANNAVVYAQKRAKRELIVEAQFRRGCALFSLERYGDAEFVLNIVKKMDEKHKMVAIWLSKTTAALQKLPEGDSKGQCTLREMPSADELEAPATNGSSAPQNGTTSPSTAQQPTPQAAAPPTVQQTPADKIRHEWYQNSTTIYFTLFAKGVDKDKVQIDSKPRSLAISFPLNTGSTYDFTLDPLFAEVNAEKTITIINHAKIEVHLFKATAGQKWSSLESKESAADISATTKDERSDSANVAPPSDTKAAATAPSYPTSSKSGPKDWDKIVKDVRKAENQDQGKDSDERMADDDDDMEDGDETNKFFKKLFKGASPEVQRAMMKSYTESNGTALSTNWEEVSKGKVETVPPDGMEARSWEK